MGRINLILHYFVELLVVACCPACLVIASLLLASHHHLFLHPTLPTSPFSILHSPISFESYTILLLLRRNGPSGLGHLGYQLQNFNRWLHCLTPNFFSLVQIPLLRSCSNWVLLVLAGRMWVRGRFGGVMATIWRNPINQRLDSPERVILSRKKESRLDIVASKLA